MSAQHTPTPWDRLPGIVEPGHPIYEAGKQVIRIVQRRGPGVNQFTTIALVDSDRAWEDAAFIVRAVNAHDKLVAAVEALLDRCEYPHLRSVAYEALSQAKAAA